MTFSVTPTSGWAFRQYRERLLRAAKRPTDVITAIGLAKRTGPSGQSYSVATFQWVRNLTDAERTAMKIYAEALQAVIRPPVTAPQAAETPGEERIPW
jgi:hypothetical protein